MDTGNTFKRVWDAHLLMMKDNKTYNNLPLEPTENTLQDQEWLPKEMNEWRPDITKTVSDSNRDILEIRTRKTS